MNLSKPKTWYFFAILIIGTATIFFQFASASKGEELSRTKIVWSSKEINTILAKEDSFIIQEEFTSDADLENVDLFIVPELRPFIKVIPNSFTNISAGAKNKVNIYFSAGPSDLVDTYDGTIHVRSHDKTYSQPLKVSVGVCESYGCEKLFKQTDIVIDSITGDLVINNQLLIVFKTDVSRENIESKMASLNLKIVGYLHGLNLFQVEASSMLNIEEMYQLLNLLTSDSDVEGASLNRIYSMNLTPSTGKDPEWFSDKFYGTNDVWDEKTPAGNNWGLEAIQAPSAWNLTTGSSEIKIGIVDGGFYASHPDLLIPESNLFDGNPFNSSLPRYLAPESDPDYQSHNNHGTHVAGIIGALSNNDQGITGIMWKKDLIGYRTSFTDLDIALGIQWLAAEGTKVINLSLGKDHGFCGVGHIEDCPNDSNISDKIGYEITKSFWTATAKTLFSVYPNLLIIQSAGNDGIDAKWNRLFASIEDIELRKRILIVGNISNIQNCPNDCFYTLSSDSNFGDRVNIAAPGDYILSTIAYEPYYESMGGTSMAAPYVTGVSGLILSEAQEKNIPITPAEIKNLIIEGAELDNKVVHSPKCEAENNLLACHNIPMLNAFYSVALVSPPAPVTVSEPTNIVSDSLTLSWSKNIDPDFESYRIYRATRPNADLTNSILVANITNQNSITFTDNDMQADTAYYYKIYIFDKANLSSASNEVSATTLPSQTPNNTIWPMFRYNSEGNSKTNFNGIEQPSLKWSKTYLGTLGNDSVVGSDGTLYLHASNEAGINEIVAINPVNGEYKWRVATEGFKLNTYTPAIGRDGTIYAGGKKVYAINPNGTVKWVFSDSEQEINNSSPVLDSDGTIYILSVKDLFAINPDGSLKWKINIAYQNQSFLYNGINIADNKVYVHGVNYYGYYTNFLSAFDLDGHLLWNFDFDDRYLIRSVTISANGNAYVITDKFIPNNFISSELFVINSDGSQKWKLAMPGPAASIANLSFDSSNNVYLGLTPAFLYPHINLVSINPDGVIRWAKSILEIDCVGAVDKDNNIYVTATEIIESPLEVHELGYLYSFSQSGNMNWKIYLGERHSGCPVLSNNQTIYTTTYNRIDAVEQY